MKILGEALLTVADRGKGGREGRDARRCPAPQLPSIDTEDALCFRPLFHRLFFSLSLLFFFFSIVESVIPLTGNCLGRQMFRPNARRWDYRGSFCCSAYILDWCLLFISFFISPSSRFFPSLLTWSGEDFSIVSINFSLCVFFDERMWQRYFSLVFYIIFLGFLSIFFYAAERGD